MKFKKILSLLICVLLSFSATSVFAAAENIIINGKEARIPSEMGVIMEKDDRTFVPIRFIMENLGCSVEFIDSTKTAVIESISCVYLIQDGNPILYIINENSDTADRIEMDTTAFISEVELNGQTFGRMYVPIRFLAQAIGYDVGWDEATQTVTLMITK